MPAGKVNVYQCCRNHQTITIDADEGVTSFMVRCKASGGCTAASYSSMYRVDQDQVPKWEWYKPNESEHEQLDKEVKEHVDHGGLLLRKLTPMRRQELAKRFPWMSDLLI